MHVDKQILGIVVDKQFEMIGENFSLDKIPEDNYIQVGKKVVLWYEHYKFNDENQYKEWREWSEKIINNEKMMNYIDLRYGMTYRYKKEGQLF